MRNTDSDQKYLTPELKEAYMSDFRDNVLNQKDKFWKLDSGLEEILTEVNENAGIQTLYSKYYNDTDSATEYNSYLTFCYSKEAELYIFQKVLPGFINKYSKLENSVAGYMFFEPGDNQIMEKGADVNMACINDPDYFRVNHIRLSLECRNVKTHHNFWRDIKMIFTEI